jgi:PAS domain-containing protein
MQSDSGMRRVFIRSLFQAISDLVFVITPAGRLVFANASVSRALGCEHLAKPVQLERLAAVLRRFLGGS